MTAMRILLANSIFLLGILHTHARIHAQDVSIWGIRQQYPCVCHKNDLSTLLLCDDLSGEDHNNVSTNKEDY